MTRAKRGHDVRTWHNRIGVASGYKMPIDRRVDAKTVVCPDCGADIGEPCIGVKVRHAVRRRLAVRLLNEEL